MQVGSIIAYEGGMGDIYYAEVIDSGYTYWNGEKGVTILPFGEISPQCLFESDCWLLADNL
tara:strand:- start:242 stop:424 length:183 start_codon:yes stop_codon:yes gene_type:complete